MNKMIPQSEFMKLTLMMGILLVLVMFYGIIFPSPCRFILLPFIIAWIGWLACRVIVWICSGIAGIVRGIGK